MNHINKLLLLIILFFLINHIANNDIMNILSNVFTKCKNKAENFMGLTYINKRGVFSNTPEIPYQSQSDFAYINNNERLDDESYNLYKFLDSLVRPDNNMYQLTASNSERYEASNDFEKDIISKLSKFLNCKGYQVDNIKLLERLVILKNPRGIEIEPFKISAEISYKGRMMGMIVLYIESFYRYDTNPKSLTLQKIKLIDRKRPKEIPKPIVDTLYKKKIEFDASDIFIKSNIKEDMENMTDNILIPSVNLDSHLDSQIDTELNYEVSSETMTSNI